MAWDRWQKQQQRNAFTGIPESTKRNAFTGIPEQDDEDRQNRLGSNVECQSRFDCGSGFTCKNGKCVSLQNKSGPTFRPSGCGDDNKNPCDGKNGSECTEPSPGECQESECPPGSKKCCRQTADGSVKCLCRECEPEGNCNPWCDQNYKTFGTLVPGCNGGGTHGCSESICTDCSFCDPFVIGSTEGTCTPFSGQGPCWCNGCSEPCHRCDRSSPSSPTFGECVRENDCLNCYERGEVECPDCQGKTVGPFKFCGFDARTSREALDKAVENACAKENCDKCAPTGGGFVCKPYQGGNPYPPANYCPPGEFCKITGTASAGSQACFIYSSWDLEKTPEGCLCDDTSDCDVCKYCSDGTCIDGSNVNIVQDGKGWFSEGLGIWRAGEGFYYSDRNKPDFCTNFYYGRSITAIGVNVALPITPPRCAVRRTRPYCGGYTPNRFNISLLYSHPYDGSGLPSWVDCKKDYVPDTYVYAFDHHSYNSTADDPNVLRGELRAESWLQRIGSGDFWARRHQFIRYMVGYGATEAEAIADQQRQFDEFVAGFPLDPNAIIAPFN